MGRSRAAIVVALALTVMGLALAPAHAHLPHAGATHLTAAPAHTVAVAPGSVTRMHKLKRRVAWLGAGSAGSRVDLRRRDWHLGAVPRQAPGMTRARIQRYDAPANAPPRQRAPHLELLHPELP